MNFVITTYNIKECGYYRMGEKSSPLLGGTENIFSDLDEWLSTCATLNDTAIGNAARRNIPAVFVYEIMHKGHDYLITTWNSREPRAGTPVLGVDGTTPPGNARVENRKFSKNVIPGIPTYFLVAATEGILVTLCPEGAFINGHAEFDYYVEAFLGRHASFLDPARTLVSDAEGSSAGKCRRVVGLEGNEEVNVFPRFASKPDIGAANKKYLRENASKIRRIVHSIDLTNKTDREKKHFMVSLMELTGLKTKATVSGKFCMRYELDLSLDTASVNELIKEWDSRPETWSNIGFLMKGENTPVWLDGGLKRKDVDLPVSAADGVYPATALLSALENIRSSVI